LSFSISTSARKREKEKQANANPMATHSISPNATPKEKTVCHSRREERFFPLLGDLPSALKHFGKGRKRSQKLGGEKRFCLGRIGRIDNSFAAGGKKGPTIAGSRRHWQVGRYQYSTICLSERKEEKGKRHAPFEKKKGSPCLSSRHYLTPICEPQRRREKEKDGMKQIWEIRVGGNNFKLSTKSVQ